MVPINVYILAMLQLILKMCGWVAAILFQIENNNRIIGFTWLQCEIILI